MGLFGRFRALSGRNDTKTDTSRQDALYLIDQGNALEDEGQLDQALRRYEDAIHLAPNLARAHLNRGNVLLERGNVEAALDAYATALIHSPDYAAAHYNSGNAYLRSGRREAALAAYDRAIEFDPDFVDAETARSNVLNDLGRLDDAVASYRRVLKFKPDHPQLHYWLGNTLKGLGRLDEAAECYQRAGALKPDFVEAHSSLGSVLQDLGLLEDAAASYRRALEIKDDLVGVQGNLGNVLKDLGQLAEAVASYRRVLEIQPDSAEAHSNLGIALSELGQIDDAMASYRRALELNSGFAAAHNNIGSALKDLGQFDNAEASYRSALRVKPDYAEAYSNLLFLHNCRASQPAVRSLADARRYGEMVTRQARCPAAWSNPPEPDRCVRVGFMSGDLRAHPVGYFIEGVLAAFAQESAGRLEFHVYPTHSDCDEITERIKAHCHGWHSTSGLSDKALAAHISKDGIDILVDLCGHTARNRLPLFAWKPAPVQVSWLGYFATTGVTEIDYLIADPWTLPESEEANFTEQIWRLPETRLCFTPPGVNLETTPLPALANGFLTFACFNNLTKINDSVVALWSRVLTAVPDSRLFLMAPQLGEASAKQGISARFAAHGIGSERLILEGRLPRAEYLATYQLVDVALDPFPYTGGTTTVEALWMGVPVLTLAGESFLARQGVGLLMNAGLPEWIAADADDYVARAVAHAGDHSSLASLRQKLRRQVLASPIFDASRFACYFEAALRGMWRTWCKSAEKSNRAGSQ